MTQKDHKPAQPAFAMQQLESSNIAACGYDGPTRTLAVAFKNGGTYHFADVPPEVAEGLAGAESAGSFFAKSIRGKFTSTKQEAPEGDGLQAAA